MVEKQKRLTWPVGCFKMSELKPIEDYQLDQIEKEAKGNPGVFNRGLILILINKIRELQHNDSSSQQIQKNYEHVFGSLTSGRDDLKQVDGILKEYDDLDKKL